MKALMSWLADRRPRGRTRAAVRPRLEELDGRCLLSGTVPTDPVGFTPDTPFKIGNYYIDVPSTYDASNQTPTTLFIWSHGAGGYSQYDIYDYMWTSGTPYIEIALDTREGSYWDVDADPAVVLAAIADVKTHFNIDPTRVILGGYSSGGDLSYRVAFTNSTQIAGVLAENTSPFRDTGLTQDQALSSASFKFHVVQLAHTEDNTYPIATVRSETDAVKNAGFPLQLIERPGAHYDDNTKGDAQTLLLPHISDGWTSPSNPPPPASPPPVSPPPVSPPPVSPPPPMSPPAMSPPPMSPPPMSPMSPPPMSPPPMSPPPGGSPTSPPPAQPSVFVGQTQTVVGSPDGSLQVLNPDGSVANMLTPFPGFAGEVRTAAGANGQVVAGTGPGAATQVRVLDPKTQGVVFDLNPFEASFTGGVFVSTGDFFGTGVPDVIVSPDQGGGPRVRIVDPTTGQVVADFLGINDPNFRGGARTAAADVNGDGVPDLIVAAGFGGGPRVTIFDGKSVRDGQPVQIANFFVFEQTLRNGVYVTAGDVNGDGYADVIVGGGPGGGPRVFAVSGKDLAAGNAPPAVLANFLAGDAANRGGVRVAVKDLDGDAKADLLTAPGPGGGTRITAYAGKDITPSGTPPVLFGYDDPAAVTNGAFVG